jgi:signal transduction histidine kinase
MLYFWVQYTVLKRIELLYYSLFLFFLGIYNYAFIVPEVFHINFNSTVTSIFSAIKLPLTFVPNLFYILFIIYFLDIAKTKNRFLKLFNHFKYYNIIFAIVFLVLGIFQIVSWDLFHLITLVILIFSIVILTAIWRIKTIYAKVILYGTSLTVFGICLTHTIIMTGPNPNGPNPGAYIPLQISQIVEVFILGYGLSLKSAESDKKLVQTLLENQQILEKERSRFAKDLHDGLGGLLSGVKLTLSSIPGNIVLSDKNSASFTKAISQLDTTITELRRVAHSMMPEALLRFGLSEAIQDYCDGINESNAVRMKFTQIGLNQPLDKPVEVTLYRIIQELTNNSIKHAAAKNIFIQLNKHEQGLMLTVEDDGKGFDASRISKGAGLNNVQSRVDYLNGTMEIISKPGEGAAFTIEIPA